MRTNTLDFALAGASLTLASPAPAPQITKAPMIKDAALARRSFPTASDALSPEERKCYDKLLSVEEDWPWKDVVTATDTELLDFILIKWQDPAVTILGTTKIEERCTLEWDGITPPAPLASSYSSWKSAESVGQMGIEGLLVTDTDSCITIARQYVEAKQTTTATEISIESNAATRTLALSVVSSTSTSAATGTETPEAASASATLSTARETGMVIAAAAAAVAVVGAMAGL
ncbi:hypothetical protein QBC44DRAFT_367578 [Cladorrhinum sp. PSN332]|nr:hypothetical protein QBC44DRAFT_367578 [Cladorrhinum sp. PSN332]